MSQFRVHVENGFCNSDQKSMLMVGFLTRNDSDILRSKTSPHRQVGYQTNILPTVWIGPTLPGHVEGVAPFHLHLLLLLLPGGKFRGWRVGVTLGSPRYGQGLLGLADIRSATRLPPQPLGPPGVPLGDMGVMLLIF